MREWPKDGKVFVAANPWPLAAQAKAEGLDTSRFREGNVPDGMVYVFDLDELGLPEDPWRDSTPVAYAAAALGREGEAG